MKKSLIALAALAAVSAASAQSSVTLYGRLDAGYQQTKTTVFDNAGNSGTIKVNGIQSNGLSTSMWGLKGSEDLGGGLKANFVLEGSVDVASGPSSLNFTRDSTIGLSGGFGAARIGRSYTPLYRTVYAGDVFGTVGATTVNFYPDGVRASNAFFYDSPDMGGFSAGLMVGKNDATVTTSTTGNTFVAKSDVLGFNMGYANGPLMVMLGYGSIKGELATLAIPLGTTAKTTGAALSATYDLGVAKLYANLTDGKNQGNTAVNSYNKSREANFGVSVPMGAITLLAGVGRNTSTATVAGVDSEKQTGNDFVVGATYSLSKRTTAYVKAGDYNKLGATTTALGTKTRAGAIGLRHTF